MPPILPTSKPRRGSPKKSRGSSPLRGNPNWQARVSRGGTMIKKVKTQKSVNLPTRRRFLTSNFRAASIVRLSRRQNPPLWDPVMDKKRLEYYKKKLLARREELMKIIARTEEEGRAADDDPTVDLADKAANSYTKEFLFGMTNTDR